VADTCLLLFVNRMDDRTFRFGRPFLDDPDRAKTQALCLDLAITAEPPSGQGTKPCWVLWGHTAIKSGHAANCLRLPPLLTIVFFTLVPTRQKTNDPALLTYLEQLPISPSLLSTTTAGSTERFFWPCFKRELALP
jgi:hypothetical protein